MLRCGRTASPASVEIAATVSCLAAASSAVMAPYT